MIGIGQNRASSRIKHAGLAIAALFALFALSACDSSSTSRADAPASIRVPKMIRQADGRNLLQPATGQIPGITTTLVKQVELPGVIEANGQVAYDEQNEAQIVSRVAGRIEAARAVLWDRVRRGEPIVLLYSPDFMTAEAEYLEGLSARKIAPGGPGTMADAMVSAARRKLELLGMSADDIAALKAPSPTIWMRAPISGTVVKNTASIGGAVNPGDVLYQLGTTSRVWITASIYEDELARIHVGQDLQAVTTAYPGEIFYGVITRISLEIDPNTHTAQIRCEIRNPDGRLKPQMLARVKILSLPASALVVPEEALIFETNSYYVFVDLGGGLFDRRKVEIGSWRERGFTRVVSGLRPGERVVAAESLQIDELWNEANGTS